MDDQQRTAVPLIGTLFVEAGLITPEQLDICLLLQSEDYLGIPLGQILLSCGYITAADLARILRLQIELRASVAPAPELPPTLPADLTAVLLARSSEQFLVPLLQQLGVAAHAASSWADIDSVSDHQQPDLMLIDPGLLDPQADISDHALIPTLILPLNAQALSAAPARQSQIVSVVIKFVARVRERRQQAFKGLQQRAFEISTATTISRVFTTAQTPEEALSRLMIKLRDLFDVEAGTLYRLDQSTNQLVFEVVFGPSRELLKQQRTSLDRGVAGWVARNRKPLLIPDVTRDPRFNRWFDQQTGFRTRSILCIPLIAFGEVYGVLQLINKVSGETFSERELVLLRISATMLALAQSVAALDLRSKAIGHT